MSVDSQSRVDWVGPVLSAGAMADAIVAAIRERNRSVVVEDRASYLRVLAPSPCVLDRSAVERRIGGSFQLPGDLEQVMPSFKGRLTISEEQVVWTVGEGALP